MSIYGNFSKPMLHTGLLDGTIKDSSSYIYIVTLFAPILLPYSISIRKLR